MLNAVTPFITPDPPWLANLPLVVAIMAFLLAFGLSHMRAERARAAEAATGTGIAVQLMQVSSATQVSAQGLGSAPPRRHDRLPRRRARLQRRHAVHHPGPALAQRRTRRPRHHDAAHYHRPAASDSERAAGGRMMRVPMSVGSSGRRSKAVPESPRHDFGRAGGIDLRRHALFVMPAQAADAQPAKTRPAWRARQG